MKGFLPKYFSSEWSLAQFKLPEFTKSLVAFGPEPNTLVVVTVEGTYYKIAFDPKEGGLRAVGVREVHEDGGGRGRGRVGRRGIRGQNPRVTKPRRGARGKDARWVARTTERSNERRRRETITESFDPFLFRRRTRRKIPGAVRGAVGVFFSAPLACARISPRLFIRKNRTSHCASGLIHKTHTRVNACIISLTPRRGRRRRGAPCPRGARGTRRRRWRCGTSCRRGPRLRQPRRSRRRR